MSSFGMDARTAMMHLRHSSS